MLLLLNSVYGLTA